jgi:hypothetical protein
MNGIKSQGVGRQAPSIAVMDQYRAYIPNATEVIWQPLYDYQTYAAGGQLSLNFFQTPAGSGTKSYADTNMQMAAQLPAGMNFLAVGIEVDFFPGGTIETTIANSLADDVRLVYTSAAFLEVNLFEKNYLREAPLIKFPPAAGLTGFAATNITAGGDGCLIEYARNCGPLYQITPLKIPSTQNFNVRITWPAVQAISVAGRIGVRLLGFTYRNSQ